MVTCVVLEPDGVEVERRRQVQDVRTATLQQVRDDQLRPETYRCSSPAALTSTNKQPLVNISFLTTASSQKLVNINSLTVAMSEITLYSEFAVLQCCPNV